MLNLDLISIGPSGHVINPKHCKGCIFRCGNGRQFINCDAFLKAKLIPMPDSKGRCRNKITGAKGPVPWRQAGYRRLQNAQND